MSQPFFDAEPETTNPRSWTPIVWELLARALVVSHFVFELIDKITRFDHWTTIIAEQADLGVWSLWLVILLLACGSFSLLSGKHLWFGTFCLALFQIPTSLLFEDSLYESFDSLSALGGVLAMTLLLSKETSDSHDNHKLDSALYYDRLTSFT